MIDESQDQPVLSAVDRTLLKASTTPSDAQLEATRRALGARLAALAAGAAVAQGASTAQATGAATAATGAAATTTAATTATQSLAAFGAAKWISAGLIVTAVAGGSVLATRESRPVEQPHLAAASAAASEPRASAAPQIAPAAPLEQVLPAEEALPATANAQAARRPVAKPARRAATEQKPARALEGETLSAELSLLHRARQALAQGDAAGSLQALDTHAARYPSAVLRQEALSARALALCALGRTADARRAAAQLERIAPRSPHLIRLADSCALEDADSVP